MRVEHVGIIIGGKRSQSSVNTSHGQDIGQALASLGYTVHYYDLAKDTDIEQLMLDRKTGKLDIMFNNTAGKQGGDGSVEGLLDIIGVPYVGSDHHATSLAFDKELTKKLVAQAGVPIVPGFVASREEAQNVSVMTARAAELGYPLVVKAVRGSDSIGVSYVGEESALLPAIARALLEDDHIMIERFVKRSADITCMVLGTGTATVALTPIESIFDAKVYSDDIADQVIMRVPQVDPQIISDIEKYSLAAHQALGCRDYSRTDYLVDEQGQVFFLELNAHAGLGKESITMFVTKESRGWNHQQTVEAILSLALLRLK